MTENDPQAAAGRPDASAIDPKQAAEAMEEVSQALAVLPRRRWGCSGRFLKVGTGVLLLVLVFVYWNFLRTPSLRISRETTYITEPLTSDGKYVDYAIAQDKLFDRPEMQAEDNGYRMLVGALGIAEEETGDRYAARRKQVYEKLGLDPASQPTLRYAPPYEILNDYGQQEGLGAEEIDDLWQRMSQPWTFQDLPMLEPWLEQNSAALDLLGEAVRKRTYCCPLVHLDEDFPLMSIDFGDIQRTRSLARGLMARANYRLGTGDIDGAIYDVVTCLRLGRHLTHQGTIVTNLVGIALEGIADSIGIAGNPKVQPTREQWQRYVEQLAAAPPRTAVRETLQTERFESLHLVQTLAQGQSVGALEQESPALHIRARLPIDWNVVMRRMNELFDDPDQARQVQVATGLTFGDLFLGRRSRNVADAFVEMLFPAVEACEEAEQRAQCSEQLLGIAIAMLMYAGDQGTLPPAYTADETGRPLHSWRVLLLPYLGERKLYDQLRLDEPWDSTWNRKFHDQVPQVYRCPSTTLAADQTSYSVVVGDDAPFGAGTGKPLSQFGQHMLLVVERELPVGWMEPDTELTSEVARRGLNRGDPASSGLGSPHPAGMNAGLRDGSAMFFSETIDSSVLEGLINGTAKDRTGW